MRSLFFLRCQIELRVLNPLGAEMANPDRVLSYFSSMTEKICTSTAPYDPQNPDHKKFRWEHPDAIEVEEDYGKGGGVADGDYVKYKCPHCGHSFWVELPN